MSYLEAKEKGGDPLDKPHSWFMLLDLLIPVLIEVWRMEKDEVCPTWNSRRGEEIFWMNLTMASCCLKAVLPGGQGEERRSS